MAIVLLFGSGLQSLSIAQGLKEQSHSVVNLGKRNSVGKYSKNIDIFIPLNPQVSTIDALQNCIEKYKIDVVIPMEDENAELLSKNKSKLESSTNCRIACVDTSVYKVAVDKSRLLDLCKKYMIPHPRTINLDSANNPRIPNDFKFPALIKPNISNGSRGITKVANIEEFYNKYSNIVSTYGQCTLQEYIKNDHYYNVMLYRYRDGNWAPNVVTKISRYYPINGGSSSFCTTIINEKLTHICKELLSKLGWYGFADLDILEKDNEDYRIIEINPRVPASVHAALVSGINFGCIIVEDLLSLEKTQMNYNPGESLRCLGLDIAWFMSSPERLSTKHRWFHFYGKHLHYQEGGRKDWLPMIYSLWLGLIKQISPSFRQSKKGMN